MCACAVASLSLQAIASSSVARLIYTARPHKHRAAKLKGATAKLMQHSATVTRECTRPSRASCQRPTGVPVLLPSLMAQRSNVPNGEIGKTSKGSLRALRRVRTLSSCVSASFWKRPSCTKSKPAFFRRSSLRRLREPSSGSKKLRARAPPLIHARISGAGVLRTATADHVSQGIIACRGSTAACAIHCNPSAAQTRALSSRRARSASRRARF